MHESSHRAFSHELQNIFLFFEIFFLYFLVFGAEHNHAPFKISRMGKGTTGSDIFQGSVTVWATGSYTLQNVCVLKKVHWLRGFVCKSLGWNVCFSYADSKKIKKKNAREVTDIYKEHVVVQVRWQKFGRKELYVLVQLFVLGKWVCIKFVFWPLREQKLRAKNELCLSERICKARLCC